MFPFLFFILWFNNSRENPTKAMRSNMYVFDIDGDESDLVEV